MPHQTYMLFVNGEPKKSAEGVEHLQDFAGQFMRSNASIKIRVPTDGTSIPKFLSYSFEEKQWRES